MAVPGVLLLLELLLVTDRETPCGVQYGSEGVFAGGEVAMWVW